MIRRDLKNGGYGSAHAISEMIEFAGKEVTIVDVWDDDIDSIEFEIDEDSGQWTWTPEMLEEPISKFRQERKADAAFDFLKA